MKKLLLLITLIILAICLSSCTKEPTLMETLESVQSNPSVASSEDIDSDNTEEDASLSEIELIENFVDTRVRTIKLVLSEYNFIDDIVIKAVNKYLFELGTDYKLEVEYLPEIDYLQSLDDKMAMKDKVDIMLYELHQQYSQVENKYLLDLNDYLTTDEGLTLKQSIPDSVWNNVLREENIYGIVGNIYPSSSHGYIVNKNYMEKYGLEEEDLKVDMSELYDILKTIKGGENIISMYIDGNIGFQPPETFSIFDNFAVERETKQVLYTFDLPSVDSHMRALETYKNEGLLADRPLPLSLDKMFMLHMHSYSPTKEFEESILTSNGDYAKRDIDYVFIPIDDNVYLDSNFNYTLSVNKNSEYIDESFDFLTKLMSEKKLSDLFIHGVENLHYTIKDNKVLPIYSDTDSRYKGYIYKGNPNSLGNHFISTPTYFEYENKGELMKTFYDSAVVTEFANIHFDINKDLTLQIKESSVEELKKYITDTNLWELTKKFVYDMPVDYIGLQLIALQCYEFMFSDVNYEGSLLMVKESFDNVGGQEIIAEIEKILLENGVK